MGKNDEGRQNILIDGGVNIPAAMTHDEWLDRFCEWLESQDCYFTGHTIDAKDAPPLTEQEEAMLDRAWDRIHQDDEPKQDSE